jgi:CRISPR-associated protein Cmr5
MNKKKIDKLIPEAIRLLHNFPKEKVYQGYLASFGPIVITSGILQTVMFYTSDDKKNRVIELMYTMIKDQIGSDKDSMQEMLNENDNYRSYAIKNKILEASVACKLAIRTFELKD